MTGIIYDEGRALRDSLNAQNTSNIIRCCNNLRSNYLDSAKELGYRIVSVAYNATALENERKGEIYFCVEYERILFEKTQNRKNIQKLIPKNVKEGDLEVHIKLEFTKLPRKVAHQLKESRQMVRSV